MEYISDEFQHEFLAELKRLKKKLANFEVVDVARIDLEGTIGFNSEFYSDDIYLYRDKEDYLVYLHDEADNSHGDVIVEDLKVILENVVKRELTQKIRAIEIERFLSE